MHHSWKWARTCAVCRKANHRKCNWCKCPISNAIPFSANVCRRKRFLRNGNVACSAFMHAHHHLSHAAGLETIRFLSFSTDCMGVALWVGDDGEFNKWKYWNYAKPFGQILGVYFVIVLWWSSASLNSDSVARIHSRISRLWMRNAISGENFRLFFFRQSLRFSSNGENILLNWCVGLCVCAVAGEFVLNLKFKLSIYGQLRYPQQYLNRWTVALLVGWCIPSDDFETCKE